MIDAEPNRIPGYRADVVASDIQPDLDQSGIPSLFQDALRDRWIVHRDRVVLSVKLQDRTGSEWEALGTYLMYSIFQLGQFSGLSIDGQWPLAAATAWLTALEDSGPRYVASVVLQSFPHPGPGDKFSVNLSWNSIQARASSSWLESLWDTVPSDMFNAGADLLLAVYKADTLSRFTWDRPLTMNGFARTLARAVAWMIPIDGNVGFIVGLPRTSRLYARFVDSALQSAGSGNNSPDRCTRTPTSPGAKP